MKKAGMEARVLFSLRAMGRAWEAKRVRREVFEG